MAGNYLFHKYDLDSVLSAQQKKVKEHIDGMNEGQLTSEPLDELVQQLQEDFMVNPITLIEGAIGIDVKETRVDVSWQRDRDILDRSRQFLIPGISVDYFVPFSGDKTLFECRPSTFSLNPPHARIVGEEIIISQSVEGTDASRTRGYFDQQFGILKQYLSWQLPQITRFNDALRSDIRTHIDNRLARLKAAQESVAGIGFPVRSRKVNPVPVVAPATRPKRQATTSKATTNTYDVSLSFAGEDRDYVERVANLLKQNDVNVFYDLFETAALWGTNLIDHLADIYRNRSRFVVMFISKHYVEKAWPKHERQHAQARALLAKDSYILPARFDDTAVPGLVDTVSFVDLQKLSPEELVKLIKDKLGR